MVSIRDRAQGTHTAEMAGTMPNSESSGPETMTRDVARAISALHMS
ncbi:hypothetical protein D779_3315 [Imhoffiella purpurea]|uniref:Uncharacterized protein n=1 Tax=Imhoffiella purpurea TaxID=1249627 RepID=W9VA37_9GAMM|nr:hypothetical protein D779_3315 [Imhoffiella purpurea]